MSSGSSHRIRQGEQTTNGPGLKHGAREKWKSTPMVLRNMWLQLPCTGTWRIGRLGCTSDDVLCSSDSKLVADASDGVVHAGIRKELGNLVR